MPWFYYFGLTFIIRPLLLLLTRWQVEGKENIPKDGALIVVANHLSLIDPPLLSASIPRRIVFMAKEELFHHPILGPLTRGWHAFPVSRGRADREAIRRAEQVLKKDMVLGIFPEAMRSADGQMQRGYTGAALIARRSGARVLPIGIAGSEKIRGPGFIFHRPSISVNIGKPFVPPTNDGGTSRQRLLPATEIIMERIAELLPPGYRGIYGD